jgi:hypothetical protein
MSNDKSQILPKTKWCEAKMGNDHQGLIIDEATGETIAVTYKKENAAVIIKARNNFEEMYKALNWVIDQMRQFERIDLDTNRNQIQEIQAILAKIEGA